MNIDHRLYSHFDKFGDGQIDCINCGGVLPITSAKQLNFASGVTWWPVCPPCVFDVMGADDSTWESDYTDQLGLHDEFMVHDTDYGWGERYAEDDYNGYSLIGISSINGVQYMDFMDLDPWAGSAMAGLMPGTLHIPVVSSPLARHNEVLGWLLDNEVETEHIWHKFF